MTINSVVGLFIPLMSCNIGLWRRSRHPSYFSAGMNSMRIGTRRSTMGLVQTEGIARRLRAAWSDLTVEVVKFDTRGDDDQVSRLIRHGGKGGAFVAEIR